MEYELGGEFSKHTDHEGIEKGKYHRYREDIVKLMEGNGNHGGGLGG